MSFDGVIVGAGAAGLMAALRAASRGARVALLDAGDGESSNLFVCGGLFAGAGTRFQAEAGIVDSAELWAGDIMRKTGGAVDPVILDVVTRRSSDAVHFLADELGLSIHLSTGVPFPGHSAMRLHATEAEDGRQLARMLMSAARQCELIRYVPNTEVSEVVVGDGAVMGVAAADGTQFLAPLTLLASGGFAGNGAMIARHAPEISGAVNIGNGLNDGRALQWAAALGGEWLFMDSYQGQGHVTADGLGRLGPGATSLGAIVINAEGKRFADESMGPSEFGAFVLAQPGGWAVEVFDEPMHEAMLRIGSYRDSIARGCVVQAPNAGALAALFGLPPSAVIATLEHFNNSDAADQFGRTLARRPLVPPYRAARVTGALAHTQGGLRVDAGARVLRADGSVVRNLLAAGGAAACISGHGAAGYIPGNGLGQAFALGLAAADTIAASTTSPSR